MMTQRIGDYEISVLDKNNYVVNEFHIIEEGEKKGSETTKFVGNYNKIENAVKEIARRYANEANDLKGWLVEYRAVIERAEALLK